MAKKVNTEKLTREDVATTVPVRISRYLRDRLLKKALKDRKCIPRQLLEALDPEVAKEFPGVPHNRGDRHGYNY